MKIQVLQENFSKALNICSRFSSSRVQLPVLANILLKSKKNKLLVSATNLEMSVSIPLGAKVEKEGEITVPARIISDLVSNISAQSINLEAEKEILKISASGFESSVSGMNASDYPDVPEEVGLGELKLSSENFLNALSLCLFAVSSDETRPVLTGLLMILKGSELTVVATDGFRLSQKRIAIPKVKEEKTFILPKNILSEISRISEGEEIDLSFKKAEKQVLIGVNGSVVGSRIIEGEFPDFERIIPKDTKIQILLDKEEMLRAVKLASVFARDSANVVKMEVNEASISLSAESQQSGNQKTKIDAKVKKENSIKEFIIAFNYRFLEEFLNAVKGEEVKIELSEPNAPALFLDTKDTEFLHIIMPVRLQG